MLDKFNYICFKRDDQPSRSELKTLRAKELSKSAREFAPYLWCIRVDPTKATGREVAGIWTRAFHTL